MIRGAGDAVRVGNVTSAIGTKRTINGRRDQLEGKIQERYGVAKDQAKKQIDDWYGPQSW